MFPRFLFPQITGLIPVLVSVALPALAQSVNQPPGAAIPTGYQLVYEQHFDSADALKGFAMTDPAAWKFATDGGTFALELFGESKYVPAFRSPFNIALIADRVFGDFVLEADLLQTGKEYGHRDMCLFFGVQDPSHFYYTHLATQGDDHAHNVFLVNGAPRVKFAKQTTSGVNWGSEAWHHIRLERKVGDGSVRVFFDDMKTPIMLAEDKTFGAGYVGFGSFDDTGKVDNIRIWSPTAPETKPTTFYKRPSP